MTDITERFWRREFLRPRYWSRWLLFGVMALIARLPYRPAMALGRLLGRIGFRVGGFRRRTATTNLELCFPELDPDTREQWLRAHYESLGMAAIETALLWMGDRNRIKRLLGEVQGMGHLRSALQQGRGAILLAGHFTHLEMGGALLAGMLPLAAVYRPHKDPLFEAVMARSRHRYGRALRRDDARGMFRALRDGLPMWYAPDQNYKGAHGTFAPFFGIPAATNAAAGRIARISRAPVLPFTQQRLPDGGGYRLIIGAPLENFPLGDPHTDAARVNLEIEKLVRQQPQDYLWVHRRFKSRPPGEPRIYPRTPRRRRRRPTGH